MLKKFFTFFNLKHSIFARLFIILLAIFSFAFFVFTALWYSGTSKLTYGSYTSHISDIINRSNEQFEDELRNITTLVTTLSNSELTLSNCRNDFKGDSFESYSSYLGELSTMYAASIIGISVMNTNGNYISVGSSYIPKNYTETPWYKQIMDARGSCCYTLKDNYRQSPSQKYLTVGCAIIDKSSVVGVAMADINPSVYVRAFGINSLNAAMRTIIFDNNNELFFTNDITLNDEAFRLIMENSSPNGPGTKISKVTIGDTTYLLSSEKSSYTGWTNTSFFDKNIIDSEYRRVLSYTLFVVILILMIAVAVAMLISYVFSKKIHKLTTEIDNVNLDDIDTCEYNFKTESSDEIGIISSKISEMIQKISGQFTEIQTLTEQKRLSDIHVLKSQVNPHFLYNALNSIDMLAKIHNDKPISNLTCSLINLLHYSISTDNILVTIEDEMNYIKNYIEIMQTKFLDEINVIYDIEPTLEKCKTLRMILQPIVENCIKHAFDNKAGKQIFIKAAHTDSNVTLTVTDNGKGISPELTEQLLNGSLSGEHFGLTNVNKRIKLTFGEEYGLDILSIPGVQTSVIIKIPYIESEDWTNTSKG